MAFLLIILVVLAAGDTAAAQTKLPNIVVFLADDLGWGDLACYGHPTIKTPNLDRFASQGVKFNQCYAASAVCSPSRSAILTGRTPYRNGVFTWIPEGSSIHLRQTEISVATLLKKKGYQTGHFGKWHLNGKFASPDQPQPSNHGFDWYFSTQNNAAPNHLNPVNFVRNGQTLGPLKGPSAVLVVEEAIGWLKQSRNSSHPFFLAVWTHEPHQPIESDLQFLKLYPGLEPDLAQHHANVSQLDHAFGLLMKALDELGQSNNTFVIFTSDNGPEGNGKQGRTRGSTGGLKGRKRDVHEGGIRVPGIVRWPGKVKAASVSDEPIIGSDIFTTLCQLANVDVPSDRTIDGVSILPALEGRQILRTTPLYWRCLLATNGMEIAIRRGDWKLVSDYSLTRFELYNLKEDPKEERDLSRQDKEKMSEMARALLVQEQQLQKEGYHWPGLDPVDWNVRLRLTISGSGVWPFTQQPNEK